MFGRISRTAVDILGTLLVLTAIAVGLLGWRLSQGPISIGFVTPFVERALSRGDESLLVDVDDTVLAWAGWRRTLDVRVLGVNVLGSGGRLLLEVPEAAVSFSARALLRGLVAPTAIDLTGIRVRLVRGRDGVIRFGPTEHGPSAGEQESIAPLVIADLLRPPDPDRSLGYLQRLGVLGAGVEIADEASGRTWSARDADIALIRDAGGLRAEVAATADLGGKPVSVAATGIYRADAARLDLAMRVSDLNPAALAEIDPVLAPLAGVHLPLSGTVELGFDPEFRLAAARFAVAGENGRLAAATFNLPQDAPVRRLALRGALPDGLRGVELEEGLLDLGGPSVVLKGRVSDLGGTPRLEGTVTARDVPTSDLHRLWPRGLGENARAWITTNLAGGRVSEARAEFAAAASGKGWKIEALGGTLRFTGVDVDYLNPMPRVRGVDGAAKFTATRFDIETRGGTAGALRVVNGKIALTAVDTDAESAAIELAVNGPVRDALALVDGPPLGYLKKIDLRPEDFSGDAAVRLALRFPLKKTLEVDELDIVATAVVERLAQRQAALGQDARDGEVTLRVDREGLDLNGRITLGTTPAAVELRRNFADAAPFLGRTRAQARLGTAERAAFGFDFAPYVEGPADISVDYVERRGGHGDISVEARLDQAALSLPQLEWAKPAGTPAAGRAKVSIAGGKVAVLPEFVVTASDPAAGGLSASGSAAFAADGHTVDRVDITALRVGQTDARVTFRRSGEGVAVEIAGTAFDAGPFLRDKSPPAADRPPLELHLDLDRLYFAADRRLYAVRFDGHRGTERWATADLSARTGADLALTNAVTVALTMAGGKQQLQARAEDAGAFLKALDITPNVVGGRLEVSGATDETRRGRPLVGKLRVSEFRAVRAPILARVLSVALLTGILDSLTGEGIRFAGLEADFAFFDPRLEVLEAKASGPAIGITAKGVIDIDADTVDLDGTIVPANALNRLPSLIPLIGDILTGGGGGVFAATYKVSGPLEDAKVSVNPLSTLAPGFLRNLFGIFSRPGTSPTDATPQTERERPRDGP